jgi:multiple sugar transport system permease protein
MTTLTVERTHATARVKENHQPLRKVLPLALIYTMLGIGGVAMVFPFYFMITSSFKLESQINLVPPLWWPNPWSLDNFTMLFETINIPQLFWNSIMVAVIVTLISMYTSALVGYLFAKYRFWGKEFIFLAILGTMMIPWPVTMVPVFQICLKLGLVNNFGGIIVPYFFSTFGIFMIRQFMHTIPNDLLDAARIDGASELAVFHSVVAPNSMAAISALGIFTFLWNWDNFLWPLIILMDQKLYTLPLGIAMFAGQWWTNFGPVLAGATVSVIPVLIVFLVFQKNITEGLTMTGIKG